MCTLPLTPTTTGLLGKPQFELMRADTVFVNVAGARSSIPTPLSPGCRGGTSGPGSTSSNLKTRFPGSPVRSLPNVFLTPHIAGVTSACGPRFVTLMAEEIGRFLAGEAAQFDLVARSELAAAIPRQAI